MPGSAQRWFTRPKTVTHPGTNLILFDVALPFYYKGLTQMMGPLCHIQLQQIAVHSYEALF